MKKQWKRAVSIGCAACMLASTMPMGFNLVAEAQGIETQSDEAATSGTWGTCEWNLDEDGVLTISGGVAESLSNGAPWGNEYSFCGQIKEIKITGDITFDGDDISLHGLFKNCSNVIQIQGLEKLDTSKVTDMGSMFDGCQSLSEIDVSHFETGNVTDMSGMFSFCDTLSKLDVSHFDTSKVTNMGYMFFKCDFQKLDVSNFDTSKVTNMVQMFKWCSSLKELDVSHFDTGNVTKMQEMFTGDTSLEKLDVSHFDTGKVTDMDSMFARCQKLQTLDVSNFDTANVTDMEYMFYGCYSLKKLDVSHFNTANTVNMKKMFTGCSSLTKLDVSHFDTENVTDMGRMFEYCKNLQSLDVSHFNTKNVTSMTGMFARCSSLTTLDLSSFDMSRVHNVNNNDDIRYCADSMFEDDNITDITVPGTFDEENVLSADLINGMKLGKWKDMTTDISYEFRPDTIAEAHRYMLETPVTVSGKWGECEWIWDDGLLTVNGGVAQSTRIENGNNIVEQCPFISDTQPLRKADIQKVDIKGNITFNEEYVSLSKLFDHCFNLTEIKGLDNIDVSNVTDMAGMFEWTGSLKKINMHNWNIKGSLSTSNMFFENTIDFVVFPKKIERESTKESIVHYLRNGLHRGIWYDETADITYESTEDIVFEEGHTYLFKEAYQTKEDIATGITIKKEDGSLFDSDIELNVSDVTTNEDYADYADIANKLGNTNLMYDIALEKDAEAIQPDGKIMVSIPLPDGMSETAKVYCIAKGGTATDMNAVFADGYLTFATNHFSVYVVVDKNTVVGDVNGDGIFNMADAALVRRYVANLNVTIDTSAADANKDGKIDMVDYALMRRALANWDVELK